MNEFNARQQGDQTAKDAYANQSLNRIADQRAMDHGVKVAPPADQGVLHAFTARIAAGNGDLDRHINRLSDILARLCQEGDFDPPSEPHPTSSQLESLDHAIAMSGERIHVLDELIERLAKL